MNLFPDCNSRYDRRSFTDIVWFIAGTMFALSFAGFSFAYYRQLLTGGTRIAPSTQIRMESFPAGTASGYAPPDYPPPPLSYDPVAPPYNPRASKVPSYVGRDGDDGYVYGDKPKDANGDGVGYLRRDAKEGDDDDVGYDMDGKDHNPFRRA